MAETRTPDDGPLFFAEPLLRLGRELHALDVETYEEWLEIGELYLRNRQRAR